ncbi:MAG: APC family permease [Ignavibacteria bacterium]|nr:APC family permease [Bacteroidota bacterium]MSQ45578.1 APC family permease [Ignavibacteria bacterium]
MAQEKKQNFYKRVKKLIIGGARNPLDVKIFHSISLIAFFAWVGLGADGLSSASYGPEEAYLALHSHPSLSILVALATAITIFIISACYSQIIEVFPSGGGGYLVASKLLSPSIGMVSGCALIIDYVLTITISVASAADAVFSFFPMEYHSSKILFASLGLFLLIIINLRGIKESIIYLLPIFLIFILTHVFAIGFSITTHFFNLTNIFQNTFVDLQKANYEIGFFGVAALLLRAYSMGAGTYTGIEAVSNGLPILREPKVKTGKRTMKYMSISLAVTVFGLILAYLLYEVKHVPGKTLNAVLFESISSSWGAYATPFVVLTLLSEAGILFIAAQAGFLGGPRVLSNMAIDRWFPSRFAMLSDRLVTQNGVLLMGLSALVMMLMTGGSVKALIVLYSINVFITFSISMLGMVKHWWKEKNQSNHWKRKMIVSGTGLILCVFILVTVVITKFYEGGWLTLLITGGLILLVVITKRHYLKTTKLLRRLDNLIVQAVETSSSLTKKRKRKAPFFEKSQTAIFLVNGFNGLGLHTVLNVIRLFPNIYKNFVFVQVGILDAGNFKGVKEVDNLKEKVKDDLKKYESFISNHGFYADSIQCVGTDVVEEVIKALPDILEKYPNAVFFGGQLVFPENTFLSRWLHNYTIFTLQRKFYQEGVPVVILPVRVTYEQLNVA